MSSTERTRVATVGGISLLALGLLALVVLDARNGTLRDAGVDTTITWWLIAFAGFGVAAWANERTPIDLRVMWVVAVGARIVLLFTEPTLSDDVFRYLWEGHLVTEGISPYAFAIDDPAGNAAHIAARDLANNTSLASPYLPFAHAVFGAVAFVLPSEPWTMQLLMIGADLIAIAGLTALLTQLGLPRNRAVLYAWNPLVIVEVAHGAHIDAVIVALALWGLVATLRWPRGVLSLGAPILIAATTLTRPVAALLLLVLFWRWSWRQRLVAAAALSVPVVVTGAISGFGLGAENAGTGVFGSARAYVQTFRFNSALYQRVETFIGGRGLDDKGWNEPVALTRLVVYSIVAVALLVAFAKARNLASDRAAIRFLLVPLAMYVLAAPVLHPWYLLLPLALAIVLAPGPSERLTQWWLVAPWLTLSALVVLTYLTYIDPEAFAERVWVSRVVWWPVFALAAIAATIAIRQPREHVS